MSGQLQYSQSMNLLRLTPSGQIATTPFGSVSFSGQAAMSTGFETFQWTLNGGASRLPGIGAIGVVPHPDGGVLLQWLQGSSTAGDPNQVFLTTVQNDSQVATNPLPSSVFGDMATNDQGTVFFDGLGTSVTALDIATGNPKWTIPGRLIAATDDGGGLISNAGSIHSVDQNGTAGTDSLPVNGSATYMAEGTVVQNGPGGSEQLVRTSSPQLISFLASPWALPVGADPSSTYRGSFYSKLVTIIGWINGSPAAITTPPVSSVSPFLVDELNAELDCPRTLLAMSNGNRTLIKSDIDRQYANAFPDYPQR